MAMTEQQIQLVLAAQNGDTKSFEQLYAIYYGKVYGFARMILRNETEAEDVLQETFITAWKKLSTLQTPATFSVWIQVIAKNLCNMQLRRKNMVILLDAEQDSENFEFDDNEEFLPAVYAEQSDLKERLGTIIEGLSDIQRQTIVLYYFNELSVDEISAIMDCSPGTVKSRLFLARNTIRAEVEEAERKAGQKFYGIVGIPLLPLGKLVQSHIESLSIGSGAANSSLNAIINSISPSGGAQPAASAAQSQIANTEGATQVKKLPVKGIIISAVAVVAAVAVLVAIFTIGGNSDSDSSASSSIAGSPAASAAQPASLPDSSSSVSAGTTSSDTMVVIPQSEYQKFYDNYLSRWTLYNPFNRTYTENTFSDNFSPYFLYAGCIMQESAHADFTGAYLSTGDIPADYVEQTVTRHFPVTAAQYRALLPMTRDAYEYYDPAQDIYHFPGGYGGPEMTGTVTEVLQEGSCYYISCDWFSDDGSYAFSHTVTVELGAAGTDFYYRENTITG